MDMREDPSWRIQKSCYRLLILETLEGFLLRIRKCIESGGRAADAGPCVGRGEPSGYNARRLNERG